MTAIYSVIAAIWIGCDLKIHELRAARLEEAQQRETKFEGAQTQLASTSERLRQTESERSVLSQKYESIVSLNYEQKFKAEQLRNSALEQEIQAVKDAASNVVVDTSGAAQKIADLESKLKIANKEREDLRDLYTKGTPAKATASPQPKASSIEKIQTVRAVHRESSQPNRSLGEAAAFRKTLDLMGSTDAKDAIIARVQGAGSVTPSDLATMMSGRLASDDKLAVLKKLSPVIERPISANDLTALTTAMGSSDATKAVQLLSGGKSAR